MIFDKTGTLTKGQLQISRVILLGDSSEKACLELAAGLESQSEHPVARAILARALKRQEMSEIRAFSGRGIEGRYASKTYWLGSWESFQLKGMTLPEVRIEPGETVVYLAEENVPLAGFVLRDEIRQESRQTIKLLEGEGLETELLSGDHVETVRHVAEELGIKRFRGGLLPDDKLKHIESLQNEGKVVAMVGDGVNDAPVLAAAQVSIAMGGGAQLAHASADMVLLTENLERLPEAIDVSRKTLRIIRQNLSWAILYNVLAIPLAAAGWVAPWMAAIGMSASSLIVVINALRLNETQRKRS
jgi:Cu2+-exporting ATPase